MNSKLTKKAMSARLCGISQALITITLYSIVLFTFVLVSCTKYPTSSTAYISGKLDGADIATDRFEKKIAAVINDTLVVQLVKGTTLYAVRIPKVVNGDFEGSYQLQPTMHETSFAISENNKLKYLANSGNIVVEKFKKGKNGFVKGTVSAIFEKGTLFMNFEILLSPQFSNSP